MTDFGMEGLHGPQTELFTIVATTLAVLSVLVIVAYFSKRIVNAVGDIGESYTDLYKKQHREVMEALQGETRKALADTKALVMEHTELERILKALAERSDEAPIVFPQSTRDDEDLRFVNEGIRAGLRENRARMEREQSVRQDSA